MHRMNERNADPIAQAILTWRAFKERRRADNLRPRPCNMCKDIVVGPDDAYSFESDLPWFMSKPKAFCSKECWDKWEDIYAI